MIASLRFGVRVAAAAGAFLIACGRGTALALTRRDRHSAAKATARTIARWMHPPLGLRVEVEGEAILSEAQPCVYVCNHQSMYDVPVLAGIYPSRTVTVAAREFRRVPLFGWVFEATGNIWLDRADTEEAVHQLQSAGRAIRERGVSVWLFPEGTRGSRTGALLPFKKGPFRLAIDAGVPLVPIVVSPIAELFDPSARRIRSGTVQIRVLDPEPTAGLGPQDTEVVRDRVRGRMQAALRSVETRPE